jgi:tetratricopeptide (TPR) repeat protein
MSSRRLGLPEWLLVTSVVLAGCTAGEQPATDAAAPDPERQRVLQFWEHFNSATRTRVRGDCAAASRSYEDALALDPTHEECLYYLGQCRRELGEPGPAREAFQRLVELNPASARGHLALGALLASPDPDEPLDLESAERHLRRAHEINKEETGPLVRLGEVLLVTGRSEEARTWFEAALMTNSKSVEAALLAGYVAWEAEGFRDPGPLARRVLAAARVETPTKGVLGEGDRKDEKGVAARPLTHPLGRLLFGEPVDSLRSVARAGTPLSDVAVLEAWRAVRQLKGEYERRR